MPTLDMIQQSHNFYKKFLLIGCIDRPNIDRQGLTKNEHIFFNRKGFYSLSLMVINNKLKYKRKYITIFHSADITQDSPEQQFK